MHGVVNELFTSFDVKQFFRMIGSDVCVRDSLEVQLPWEHSRNSDKLRNEREERSRRASKNSPRHVDCR